MQHVWDSFKRRSNFNKYGFDFADAKIDLSDIPETTAEQMARSTFRINRVPVERRTPVPNWLDRLTGSISNDELFVKALEYGRSFRVVDELSDNV